MTYIELIVVLSIFSIMTSVVLFNYGKFQAKVDIKNLASEVALKIVEAQKKAMSGNLPPTGGYGANWKPSYGLFFDRTADDKSFIYFTDLNNNAFYDGGNGCISECLNQMSITKGNFMSKITVIGVGASCSNITNLNIVFTRPNSGAIMKTNQAGCSAISYAEVAVSSPQSVTALIKIYDSGRIQIN